VTILFCDLVESTKLAERFDPEARYFVGARTIVERHGGTIEKFIGDAVCAVFGMPTVREDDALRGVRAAVELRDAVLSLDAQLGPGLAARIGVNTGEVFAAGHDLSVAGDAVWTAKRLEEAAPRDGILLGPTTWALVAGPAEGKGGSDRRVPPEGAPAGRPRRRPPARLPPRRTRP
jgi:class 3 adenylate cyclase